MKKFKTLIGLSALLLTLSSLNLFSLDKSKAALAESNVNTKILAKEAVADSATPDAFIYFTLSQNDYSSGAEFNYVKELPNYHLADYNFTSYILLSKDNVTYSPLSEFTNGTNYIFNNGTFRIGIDRTPKALDFVNWPYIKILEGCEFPSYSYCKNGGTLTKYVQETTTLSKISFRNDVSDKVVAVAYGEEYIFTGTGIPFSCVNPYWNNANYADSGYRQVILDFGQDTDYFSNSHLADATEQATSLTDIGKNLTINGIPVYKIKEKFPATSVNYAHGFNHLYLSYPVEVLKVAKDYPIPTIHIPNGTRFIDKHLGEATAVFVGDSWTNQEIKGYKISNPDDIRMLTLFDLPYQYNSDAVRMFSNLRNDGCRLAFNFNTGNYVPNTSGAVTNFVLYGITISVMHFQNVIALYDGSMNLIQVYYGYLFQPKTTYNFELEIEIGSKNTVKLGLNHALVINSEVPSMNGAANDVWTINPDGSWIIDYYQELNAYTPTLSFDGTSIYDFNEGDPVYDFQSLVNVFDLYGTDSSEYHVSYQYQDGAVTNNKYNAGTWTLTITLNALGYDPIVKVIILNVYGSTSMAKIYYDDGEAVLVPVGSKLVAPKNPDTYHDDDFDYVFEGWYFEGAKWNFETDIVQGDMHLYSNFIKTERHYVVTVNFEGIIRQSETYSVSKNASLPFALFEIEGATFVVFNGDTQINSLTVNSDVSLVVKYTVSYVHHERVNPTCYESGSVEYWTSPVYPGVYFADAKGVEIIEDITLAKTSHAIIHIDAVESTCTEEGNVDCYYCTSCRHFFSDEEGEHEIDNYKTVKKAHVLTHHAGSNPTCVDDGEKEYWTCANEPGVYYADEECTETFDSIVIAATGHNYQEATYTWNETSNGYECHASTICSNCNDEITEVVVAVKATAREATCTTKGQIVYTATFRNDKFVSQIKEVETALLDHTYVHVDEVKATKEQNGVKEHYECSSCHKYFLEENNSYVEVSLESLIILYKSSGCGGSIQAVTLTSILAIGGTSTFLFLKKRKEDR